MANLENVEVFDIKNYMVIFRQSEKRTYGDIEVDIRAIVRCTGDEYAMDVLFYAEGSDFPEHPIIELDKKKGFMFLPISDMTGFVDVLRNEKPIYGHLRGDRPEWTSVTTTQEPVGEGEIDRSE